MPYTFFINLSHADLPGQVLTWRDITFSQETDTSKYGTLEFTKKIGLTRSAMTKPIEVDGVIEKKWKKAVAIVRVEIQIPLLKLSCNFFNKALFFFLYPKDADICIE